MNFKLWLETEKPLISDEELEGLLGSVKDVATRRFTVTREEAQKAVDLLERFPGLLSEIYQKYRQVFEVIAEKAGITKPFKVLPKVLGVKNLDRRVAAPTKYELGDIEKNWWKTLKTKLDKALEDALYVSRDESTIDEEVENIEYEMIDKLIDFPAEKEDDDLWTPINFDSILRDVKKSLGDSHNKALVEIIRKLSAEIPERMKDEVVIAPTDKTKLLDAYKKLAANELKTRKAAGFDPDFYVSKITKEKKY